MLVKLFCFAYNCHFTKDPAASYDMNDLDPNPDPLRKFYNGNRLVFSL